MILLPASQPRGDSLHTTCLPGVHSGPQPNWPSWRGRETLPAARARTITPRQVLLPNSFCHQGECVCRSGNSSQRLRDWLPWLSFATCRCTPRRRRAVWSWHPGSVPIFRPAIPSVIGRGPLPGRQRRRRSPPHFWGTGNLGFEVTGGYAPAKIGDEMINETGNTHAARQCPADAGALAGHEQVGFYHRGRPRAASPRQQSIRR